MWRSLKGPGYLGCCQRQRFARSFLGQWIIRIRARIFGSTAAVDGPAWTSGSLRYEDRALTPLRHVFAFK